MKSLEAWAETKWHLHECRCIPQLVVCLQSFDDRRDHPGCLIGNRPRWVSCFFRIIVYLRIWRARRRHVCAMQQAKCGATTRQPRNNCICPRRRLLVVGMQQGRPKMVPLRLPFHFWWAILKPVCKGHVAMCEIDGIRSSF